MFTGMARYRGPQEQPTMTMMDAEIATETDLSAYVLSLLDDHLAAMRDVRERLRIGGTIGPGARRTIALDSIRLAERYAARLTGALSADETDLRRPRL
jgi:hypothetical protein